MILTAPAPLLGMIAAFRALGAEAGGTPAAARTTSLTRRKPGHVTLLGAGPGAADLITLRGLAALQTADVIYYDRSADPALLSHAKPAARLRFGRQSRPATIPCRKTRSTPALCGRPSLARASCA